MSGFFQGKMSQKYPLHIFLFLVTVFTTAVAGAELATGRSMFYGDDVLGFESILLGLPFSFAFLSFLTVHEFGHYFTALYHRVRCTLPYFLPVFIPLPMMNIGSLGAVIRIREVPPSRRKYFDIGVAGPLAGFVVALGMLLYGFLSLPPVEATVLGIHPEYVARFGGVPSNAELSGDPGVVTIGGSLLFEAIKWAFSGNVNMPPDGELMHYPFIFAGFLGLFFTALNLLPIGQLDGGHVVYGLWGARRAGYVARVAVLILLLIGGVGVFSREALMAPTADPLWQWLSWVVASRGLYLALLFVITRQIFPSWELPKQVVLMVAIVAVQSLVSLLFPGIEPNPLWLLYAFLAVRVIKVDHPVALDDTPLGPLQKILGFLAIVIFIICFSPMPVVMS
jgi:membrane-associated protease RseP (regulator of RpoE activity)